MLKLGTQTGSVTNHILSHATIGQPDPVVGMGATLLLWTDREGCTVTKAWTWRNATYVQVQKDKATRADSNGMCESQDYSYEPNPIGEWHTFRQTENGQWQAVRFNVKTQRWIKTDGPGLRLGERDKYCDFGF